MKGYHVRCFPCKILFCTDMYFFLDKRPIGLYIHPYEKPGIDTPKNPGGIIHPF